MDKIKNTMVVNLIASPSSCKSTIMADIFSELKWRGNALDNLCLE